MSLYVTVHCSNFATTGQITPDDVSEIKEAGYLSIINNRPDFEGGEEQPTSEKIEVVAQIAGICYFALPFSPNQVNQSLVEAFAKVVHEAPKPILAFCRTGTRSTNIFQTAVAMGLLDANDLTLTDTLD